MTSLALVCYCGKVQGEVYLSQRKDFSRLVCCCVDCQRFARSCDGSGVLDEYGGTDILQVAPSAIKIKQGLEQLVCNKLSKQGLHRWTTRCCNTPVGNSVSLKVPFFGIIHSFIKEGRDGLDQQIPISAYLYARDALKPIDFKPAYHKMSPLFMTRALLKILRRKVRGEGLPTPFYLANGHAISKPVLIKN